MYDDAETYISTMFGLVLAAANPPSGDRQSSPGMELRKGIPRGPLYAFVNSVGRGERDTVLDLDAVPAEQVRALSSPEQGLYAGLAELQTYNVEVRIPPAQLNELVHRELPLREESWLRLELASAGPLSAVVFNAFTEDDLGGAHASLGALDVTDMRLIRSRIALPPESTPRGIEGALQTHRAAHMSVAVYNVGQGLCCALCEEPSKHPLLYFDFGCGVYKNSHTRPASMKFCFKHDPLVLLSHWDCDHFMAARLLDRGALGMKWLAPFQSTNATAVKFAAQLHLNGNILIWPPTLPSLTTSWGEIRRCTGGTLNTSGLASVVVLPRPSEPTNRPFRILLPGDAGYDDIPNLAGAAFDALVVSHHGGHASGTAPSTFGTNPPFALSYGTGNSFNHPSPQALSALAATGWIRRLDASSGSIGLGVQGAGGGRQLGCCGNGCDLGIQQV